MPTPTLSTVQAIIAQHWGFPTLRPIQEQAIQADLDRRDSLIVMPTGGGKSLCYQAPAASRPDETTVVISPLISLMKDQVDALTAVDVPALRVDSTLSDDERRHAAHELRAGRVRLLYASPERLMTPRFQSFLREIGVRTFVIDEAHCISHWGHDFRPEYRQMATLRELFPDCTVHAFTATATEQVREDIAQQLQLRNPALLVGNFDRPNLTYRVLARNKKLDQVLSVLERQRGNAGIIYCNSRKEVDQLTQKLCDLGFPAMRYRAANPEEPSEVNAADRKRTHDAFCAGKCDLVVATVAFGMGIDRSDIRFVLHTGLPKSIEHYQQEAGRAGRDGLEAECILLRSGSDMMMWKDIAKKTAAEGRITKEQLDHALQQAEAMHQYSRAVSCRHQALVEHFGQRFEKANCGACDICMGEIAFEPESTVLAQKIISCVARVGERFGSKHVAEVLRGSATDRVAKFNHDKLSTFGLLKEHRDKDVRDWIGQLVSEGYLTQTEDEFPVLKLNTESWQVLKGKQDVRLTRAGVATASKKSQGEAVSWEGVHQELFELLRRWRRDLAAKKGVPPYTIFHDGTLRDLSRIRPSSTEKLRLISGIGESKLRDYGATLLALLDESCAAFSLNRDELPQPVAPAKIAPSNSKAEDAYPHFRQGKSIAEVAALLGRAESTVCDYLCHFIYHEQPRSLQVWVDAETERQVTAAATIHGTQRLKPIYVALNEQIPYNLIRIVLARLNTQEAFS